MLRKLDFFVLLKYIYLMCYILTFNGILEGDLGCRGSSCHGTHNWPGSTASAALFRLSASIRRKTPSVGHCTAVSRQPLRGPWDHRRLQRVCATVHRRSRFTTPGTGSCCRRRQLLLTGCWFGRDGGGGTICHDVTTSRRTRWRSQNRVLSWRFLQS